MLTLEQTLAHFKIRITPDFDSPKMQRDGAQWLRAYRSTVDGHSQDFIYFGDHKAGVNEEWKGDTAHLPEDVQKKLQATQKKQRAELAREESEEHIRLRLQYEAEWPNFTDRGTTTYLQKKKITALYGCKIDLNAHGPYLLVPARDIDGNLWNWQRVYNEKLSAGGNKFFKRGRKQGLFHLIGEIKDEDTIYFAEGFATAASIHMALSSPTVCAFDCGNLLPVARAFRQKYPRNAFVFCADDDRENVDHRGQPCNPGLEAAYACRDEVRGTVRYPRFKIPEGQSDWNDLHATEGLDEVKRQLTEDAPQAAPLTLKQKVTEHLLAEVVLQDYGQDLVRQEDSLFQYTGTHWLELKKSGIDAIKNKINQRCGNSLDSKKVNSIYATFFRNVPLVPEEVNLFVPNPRCGNFLDGTLRMNREMGSGVHCLSFGPHKREDYVTWVVPIHYQCDRSLRNAKWESLLHSALEGHPDAAGLLRALKQMGGAMLVPTFPQLFFLHGVSGSRKSTIALTLAKLLTEKNVSSCDPADMKGFELEDMVNKLVNMHTDIDDHVPLPRGFMKRFEDNTPKQVNRKGKAVSRFRLPSVHIYCANELPPNFEGSGKAFERRLTLLEFTNDLTHGDAESAVIKDYQDLIWAAGPEGILNWCLEGLDDLLAAGGKFFKPTSSLAKGRDWQLERDPVGQFVRAISEGEVSDSNNKLTRGPEAKIKPAALWSVFSEWNKISFNSPPKMSRFSFYRAIKARGITKVTVRGEEFFKEVGVRESEDSTL